MILRTVATVGALLPVAAQAVASDKGTTVRDSVPVIWHFLGYAFEAGSMIAALCACLAVRFYVVQRDRAEHRWEIDLPVSALTLMFTAGSVIAYRPDPPAALLTGTGLGALGAGIITIALAWVQRTTGPLSAATGVAAPIVPPPPPSPADSAAIQAAVEQLNRID